MRSLIEQYIDEGSTQRTVAKITESGSTEVAAVAPKAASAPQAQVQPQAPAPRMVRADAMAPITTAAVEPVETANVAVAQSHAVVAGATRRFHNSPSPVQASRSTP